MVDQYFVLVLCSLTMLCLDQLGYWKSTILKWLGTDPYVHHFLCTYVVINVVFFAVALFLTRFDLRNNTHRTQNEKETTAIAKYKIQPGTNAPLGRSRFIELVSLVTFNQLIIGGISQYLFYRIHVYVHDITEEDIVVLPSLIRILSEMVVFTVIEEFCFFYTHWAFHS